MLRGIVLGEFWGIERDEWIELWAGLLGAVPAAVLSAAVAALVAVFVLGRSNRHQQALVEEQLKVQRNEAALAGEKAAMADLIAITNRFVSYGVGTDPDLIRRATVSFTAASYRWALETGDRNHASVLLSCASVLGGAGVVVSMTKEDSTGKFEDLHTAVRSILNEMVRLVANFGLAWYLDPPIARSAALEGLQKDAERLDEGVHSLVMASDASATVG
ncbi:hypothetical protein QNO00_08475 [Arthrobacter sp. zg-Y1219]|uniref:hypothetical protein n=1 Tax=Arthrobacter sp. zg-Y1219 TaxID=3049067 RepID=UPI0024C33AAD|nr:hypothetical protein [Arthrobacter sp. zg-Y1219]MDK1360299.1 hypothetical protein [Arthrobacter sp. zg-Y1219]